MCTRTLSKLFAKGQYSFCISITHVAYSLALLSFLVCLLLHLSAFGIAIKGATSFPPKWKTQYSSIVTLWNLPKFSLWVTLGGTLQALQPRGRGKKATPNQRPDKQQQLTYIKHLTYYSMKVHSTHKSAGGEVSLTTGEAMLADQGQTWGTPPILASKKKIRGKNQSW